MENEEILYLSPAKPCSILMYSHDGFGLGHLKRNFTIAKKTVSTFPHCKALLLMGHTTVPFHPIPKGIDFIKLPSIIKVNDEVWQPRTLPMDPDQFKNFRSSLIRHVAEHYKPDILLVDYVPKGVWGELMPTLQFLKSSMKETKIILGLRDIIDEPELTKQRWEKGNTYDVIREYYDKILIYGCPRVYDTAQKYGLVGDISRKVNYCGYLCKGEPNKSPQNIRKEIGVTKKYLVVITAGGGGDAYPMMTLCMDALEVLKDKLSIDALFITGPLMKPEYISALEQRAEIIPAKVLTTSYGILDYMNAADLLITMGSYNTMMEAVKLRRPTLVIPRQGPSAEQKIRAKLFSDFGFVEGLPDTSTLEKNELAQRIIKSIGTNPPELSLNMEGLNEAVRHISEYFIEKRPISPMPISIKTA
jgi:predicted glycosyltransferase